MGLGLDYVQNIWPFSAFIWSNDLRVSDRIVKNLPIPESTKHFVYAINEPGSQSSIYVLSVQNLSEWSASDADCLVRGIRPDAVVVQVGNFDNLVGDELKNDGFGIMKSVIGNNHDEGGKVDMCRVPTSSFEVLKRCFVHKINKETYENVAGDLVLKEIFGVGFNGHFVAAKKAAEDVGASFLMIESPFIQCAMAADSEKNSDAVDGKVLESGNGLGGGFGLQSSLVPGRHGVSAISVASRSFYATNDVQSRMVQALSSHLVQSASVSRVSSEDIQPVVDYEVPQFAKSVYPLLVDLHNVFLYVPLLGRALACAQKMLSDINKGEVIDNQLLSEVYRFRVAVEGLRIAWNNAGRLPVSKIGNPVSANTNFSELPLEDKSHAVFARALRSQTKKFKSIVAVVDAGGLAGLRKHWNTPVPPEVENAVEQLVIGFGENGGIPNSGNIKRLLADKPVVAVGAGATAVLGASSLSKVVPASTFIKLMTSYVPASLKLMLIQTQKALGFALSKGLGPTNVVAPGISSSALKSSTLKATLSAEKIRTAAHSIIASAEKTSLSAMRTAFYEIMRKRHIRPVGVLPWATFGCSIATCTGLLVYGDGIECAAESIPAAPSIASLGRGIQSLHQASQAVREKESSTLQKSIESLLYRFKKIKIQ